MRVQIADFVPPVEAAVMLPGTWNGWARPLFDMNGVRDIIAAWHAIYGESSAEFTGAGSVRIYQPDSAEWEEFPRGRDGLWAIGTDGWCWERLPACEDCDGEGGQVGPLGYGMHGSASLSEREGWVACATCKGTGEVEPNAEEEVAS
jgi:hypothetical protein